MTRVIFVSSSGRRREVEARDGSSLMRAAVTHDIPEIDAICNGDLACVTCQVRIDPAFLERLEPASPLERQLLRYAFDPHANSRLACAITVRPELAGLVVTTPRRQY